MEEEIGFHQRAASGANADDPYRNMGIFNGKFQMDSGSVQEDSAEV